MRSWSSAVREPVHRPAHALDEPPGTKAPRGDRRRAFRARRPSESRRPPRSPLVNDQVAALAESHHTGSRAAQRRGQETLQYGRRNDLANAAKAAEGGEEAAAECRR